MLTGIMFAYFRTRNPAFGGPMSEGARSFLQDIGLSLFVAVLASSVGPKILASFQGTVVIKIAALGLLAALVPPLLGWIYGLWFRKMNPAILAGACAGARNSIGAVLVSGMIIGTALTLTSLCFLVEFYNKGLHLDNDEFWAFAFFFAVGFPLLSWGINHLSTFTPSKPAK